MGWIKRWLPRKRWKRGALYTASTLLMAGAADMGLVQYWRRIEISPETTRVVAPLTAAGTPDYVTALNEKYGKGVTEENNAAGLLLKVMGLAVQNESAGAAGPTPAQPVAPEVVGYSKWLITVVNKEKPPSDQEAYAQEMEIMRGPWKSAEHPEWARWLHGQTKGLAEARRAVARPKLFVPLTPRQTRGGEAYKALTTMAYFPGVLGVGRTLVSEALLRAGEGDIQGFQEDIMASRRLARLVGNGPTRLAWAIGCFMERSAVYAVSKTTTTPGLLSAEACRNLLAEMDALAPMPALAVVADNDMRWELLDALCGVAQDGLATYARLNDFELKAKVDESYVTASLFLPVHYNAQLRQVNAAMDAYVAALRLPTYTARNNAIVRLMLPYAHNVNVATEFHHLYHIALDHTMGWSIFILDQEVRTEGDLARVVLALNIYRGEHGEYPEKLAALAAAGILREVPMDAFSDKPLVYERRGGGYVLYTVGSAGGGEADRGYPWRVVKVE